MLIRQANKNDVRRISYLIRKNTERVQENNYTNQQVEVWKKVNTPKAITKQLKSRVIFCAFQKDKLIGTIGLHGNEVVGLYVSYAKRGLGIGSILLQHLEKYAKSNKIMSLELTSTPSATFFYVKHGYTMYESVIVKVNEVEFKETRMTKRL